MKKLTNYAIRVTNDSERDKALKFYRLASKRSLLHSDMPYPWQFFPDHVGYVGLGNWDGFEIVQRHVTMGTKPYPFETAIPFSQIKTLADTPTRMRAYKKVFGK